MTGLTHGVAGMLVADFITKGNSSVYERIISYAVGFIGGTLPDIDTKHGTIHKILGTQDLHVLFGKHRGITHTLWATTGVYVITSIINGGKYQLIATAAYLSHLLLDSLTFSRIEPLYPIKYKWGIGICRSGSVEDALIGITLTIVLLYSIITSNFVISIW